MIKNLFLVVNVDWFFLSHRLPVALAALKSGYDVTIITKDTGKKSEIESNGLKFIDFPFERSGSNPFHEIKCIFFLSRLYKSNRPDIIHHVSLKAALLGSAAAKLAGCENVVNTFSGLGYNFTDGRGGLRQKIMKRVMRWVFKSIDFHYIFQNPDDINQFLELIHDFKGNIHLIKGSGVDLNEFTFEKEISNEKVRLVLPARMLIDKGIMEFIEAARKIKEEVSGKAEFILAGDCDTINLAGITEEKLWTMIDSPYIRWVGFQKDIFRVLREANVVVLPSYREGLPKSLIEACAVGRPVITTDAPGCRECVIDGYNGYLVPVKDTDLLSQRMETLINDRKKRAAMGLNSRKLAAKKFSIENVIEKHLEIYDSLINSNIKN
jgi:glycosyltransferase involved in cell wall biosynthesis